SVPGSRPTSWMHVAGCVAFRIMASPALLMTDCGRAWLLGVNRLRRGAGSGWCVGGGEASRSPAKCVDLLRFVGIVARHRLGKPVNGPRLGERVNGSLGGVRTRLAIELSCQAELMDSSSKAPPGGLLTRIRKPVTLPLIDSGTQRQR